MVAFMMAATSAYKWLNTDVLPPLIQTVIAEVAGVGHALDHLAAVAQDPDHAETVGADQTQDPGPAPTGAVTVEGQDPVMIKDPNPGLAAAGQGQNPEVIVNPNPDQNRVVVTRRNPDQSPGQSQDLDKDPDPGQRRI